MQRGKFELEVKEAGSIFLNIELAWGTVWLSKYEIANQFREFVHTVKTNMSTIFKFRQFLETDVVKLYHYTHKNGENTSIKLFNLDVIIALFA